MKAIHKEKILELRAKGFTYNQIKEELGCSKGTIAYHCGNNVKYKSYQRNLKNKRKNAKPLEITRIDYIKSAYGITGEEYFNLIKKCKDKCEICKKDNKNGFGTQNRLNVDHDHKTGKVRGMLCNRCNTALGLLYDNIEILKAAIKYLKKFNNYESN